jgi:hypothetical protein
MEGLPFDLAHGFPPAEEVDDICLEQADDAFGPERSSVS